MTEDEYRAEHPGVLRMYDVSMDDWRDVTQDDIEVLLSACTRLATLRSDIESLIQRNRAEWRAERQARTGAAVQQYPTMSRDPVQRREDAARA